MDCCQKVTDQSLEKIAKKCPNLKKLHISGTKINGSILLHKMMPSLCDLSVNFCPKLIISNVNCITEYSQLKRVSCYGNHVQGFNEKWKEETKNLNPSIKKIIVSNERHSYRDLRDFARENQLYLTNWPITKQNMAKGMPLMLSQIWLRSLE